MERAIEIRPATAAEAARARKLAPELLQAIPGQVSVTIRISELLGSSVAVRALGRHSTAVHSGQALSSGLAAVAAERH